MKKIVSTFLVFTLVIGLGVGTCITSAYGAAPTNHAACEDTVEILAEIDGEFQLIGGLQLSNAVTIHTVIIPENAGRIAIHKTELGVECNLDELTLDGQPPENYEKKLSKTDNDLIEVEGTAYFTFKSKGTKLIISGRTPLYYQGEYASFKMPLSNGVNPITASSDFYSYELNSNEGAFDEGEKAVVPDSKYRFTQEFVHPTSGHPDGNITTYVANDENNVYVFAEIDCDNTFDHGKDFFAVHVKKDGKVNEYAVHTVDNNDYGKWWV